MVFEVNHESAASELSVETECEQEHALRIERWVTCEVC